MDAADRIHVRNVIWLTRLGGRVLIGRLLCYKGSRSGSVMMNSPGSLRLHRIVLAAALLLVCQPALAEKRVALVLGNSAYQNVAPLPNPVNDGAVIAATLKDAGFDVVDSRHDLPAAETRRALRDFPDRAPDGDLAAGYYVAPRLALPAPATPRALRAFAVRARDAETPVVYYAGHGLEVDGTNYLIPV